jgi:cyclopropane-fatty-acyl-phospholipid synthase
MARNSDWVDLAHRVAELIFSVPTDRTFDVRYWDGSLDRGNARPPRFTIVIARPGALRRMLLPPSELSLAEAFISGDVDIEGDLETTVRLADEVGERIRRPATLARLLPLLLQLPRDGERNARSARFVRPSHDRQAARPAGTAAIRHHYDIGNAFYELWLDDHMQYSCAYFRSGRESIDEAQSNKLEHICRKLRLQTGERLLDIGCGWGGLIRYAASHYGVVARGITLSAAQAEYARARIAHEGLADRCRVDIVDYRDLDTAQRYDKVVSIGMAEHVAKDRQPGYFAAAHRILEPGGLFLNHSQTSLQRARPATMRRRIDDRLWRRNEFIERYVFPDSRLIPAAHLIASAEQAGFELRDVESLREHYALTLRHWVRRLEQNEREAKRLVGERTYRVWRLYISTAAQGFASGRINIIQTLLSKPDAQGRSQLPLTREDLYRGEYPREQKLERAAS